MYNYYTYLKKQKEKEEKLKNDQNSIKKQQIREKKLERFTKNYEERIKNFIYQMAENPIQILNQKELFSTNREKLLFEESDKILFNKGFIFTLHENEEYHKKQLNNISKISSSINNYRSKTLNNRKKRKDTKEEETNFNPYGFEISQPNMRFKPRSDLERVYDVLNKQSAGNDNISKETLKSQLNKMGFKPKKKIVGDYAERIIKPSNDVDEMLNFITSNKNYESYNNKDKLIKNNKKIDNSGAKNLHKDLYNKTYFNALENFSLFKNTCFLPDKFDYNNKNKNKNNKSKFTIYNYHEKNFFTPPNQKTKNIQKINNNNLINSNPYKYEIGSTRDIIKLINNTKNNNSKEERLIKSLENIDLFTKKIKESKHKITKKQKTDIELLKELAFEKKDNDNYKTSINLQTNEYKKNNNNYFNNYEQGNEFTSKKSEDKIKIDGKEYNRNDYEHLSNIVMQKCNYGHKKFKKLDNYFYN